MGKYLLIRINKSVSTGAHCDSPDGQFPPPESSKMQAAALGPHPEWRSNRFSVKLMALTCPVKTRPPPNTFHYRTVCLQQYIALGGGVGESLSLPATVRIAAKL